MKSMYIKPNICLQIRQETHVLVPCEHGNLCGSCAINIMSENRCPTCRSESTVNSTFPIILFAFN